jgi:exonuclease SbcC
MIFEQALAEVQAIRAKIDAIDESIHQLSAIEGNCPVCDSRLTEEKKNLLIAQRRQQMEKLEAKLQEVEEKKKQSEAKLKNVEEAARKFEQLIITIRDLEKIRSELDMSKKMFSELSELAVQTDRQLAEMRSDIARMNDELKVGIDKKQKLEIIAMQQRDYIEKKRRFDDLMKKRREIELKIAEITNKLAGKDIEQLQENLKQLAAKAIEYETKIVATGDLEKEKNSRINEYQTKLDEMKKYIEELKRLDKIIKNLRIFTKALEETQIGLRKEFVKAVNYVMSKLWQTLYPYQDFVGIRLNVDEGDYILQLQDRSGAWVNVEGQVSGGERSIACLALRISFALVLAPQLPWLVLDEPTANLDVKAIEDLAETLRERIGDFVEQVFLITHDEKLEDAVSGSLYKLEREKEKDGATKIITKK